MEEKYARPGLYLDTDNHEQLLDENREAYLRDERERLINRLQQIDGELGSQQ